MEAMRTQTSLLYILADADGGEFEHFLEAG
jgi:hypothetical protein